MLKDLRRPDALLTAQASAIRPSDVVAALGIGAVGYGLSNTLWVGGARELGAARGQVIFATAPFIGALIAWFLLGEHATAAQLAATAVAAIGVGISLTSGHEHLHPHEPLDHQHEHQHHDGHHDDHVHEPIPSASHAHHHRHSPTRHSHAHVPDLHHRHPHN